jgi:uncharacterized protein YdhG (YjbR/CyaY superfamily)
MKKMKTEFKTVDEYIATFSPEVQAVLEQVRQTVRQAAPDAVEALSYGMPAFKLNGKVLVYFAAFKSHIGFYPLPSGITAFEKDLAPYARGKGSIQFPLDKPMPLDLVTRIVKYRAAENQSPEKK